MRSVQVRGTSLLPGAAMFEAALAAGQAGLDWTGGHSKAATLTVQSAAIPSPLVLLLKQSAAHLSLSCSVRLSSKGITVIAQSETVTGRVPTTATHLSCALGQTPELVHVITVASTSVPQAVFPGVAKSILQARKGPTDATTIAAAPVSGIDMQQQTGSAFYIHPAVLDASMHTLAALQRDAAHVDGGFKVPTSLGALSVGGSPAESKAVRRGVAQGWAHAGNISLEQNGALSGSFGVSGSGTAGGVPPTMLRDLQIRPMSATPSATRAEQARQILPETHMAYVIEWKVTNTASGSSPVPGPAACGPGHQRYTARWDFASGEVARRRWTATQRTHGAVTLSNAAHVTHKVAAAALQALKLELGFNHIGEGLPAKGLHLRLWTAGARMRSGWTPARLDPECVAATAASGLVTVGAREMPAHRWESLDVHPAAAGHPVPTETGDMYGITLSGGAALQPQIAPVVDSAAEGSSSSMLRGTGGTVVVIGGTGGLGSMAGVWASLTAPTHVVLLGRQGKVSDVPAVEEGHITIARCDAAVADETGACIEALRDRGAPLSGVLHAGGVLLDAMLPKQTLAGMRGALAPKIDAIGRMAGAAGASPVAMYCLFSSTSSVLGPAGQANYSAANLALNMWAETQQSSGTQCVMANVDRAGRGGYGLMWILILTWIRILT